jgi:hypothetical protein
MPSPGARTTGAWPLYLKGLVLQVKQPLIGPVLDKKMSVDRCLRYILDHCRENFDIDILAEVVCVALSLPKSGQNREGQAAFAK